MSTSSSAPPPGGSLLTRVRAYAENRPGVYRMLDREGEVLYVGKSVRIRSRLLSYFRLDPGEKGADLVRAASRIEWEYVPNEFWALLREMRLIRRLRPRYNVEHNRRRRYGFVKVTREPAPRVLLVGKVAPDGANHYGPFPAPGRVAEALRDLVQVLGIRDCPGATPVHFGEQLELLSEGAREPLCMRAELGSCLGPCAGLCTSDEYLQSVEEARRFLEGRSRKPLDLLDEAMAKASSRLDFEYAALLRDRRERLMRLRDRLLGFKGRVRSLSFVYRVPGFRGSDRLYLIRKGRVRDQVSHPKGREERARVARRIEEVFGEPEEGPWGLDASEASEILLVARWFRLRPTELERTIPPEEWLERKRPA